MKDKLFRTGVSTDKRPIFIGYLRPIIDRFLSGLLPDINNFIVFFLYVKEISFGWEMYLLNN